ncbi:MAG: serine/threonine protein kinase [Clostridiales bacterium]|nr:serine/threonine protein kinase [Clostridiales bacterium]
MADISKYEPLWGTWKVGAVLGKGAFGKVYDATREDFGEVYHSAVKFISVPQDESEIKFLADELSGIENVSKYYKSLADDFSNEIKMMRKLEGHGNIVDFKDHMIALNPDGLGFDMLIRMELLESLSGYVAKRPLDEAMVAKLGIDICKALEACSSFSIIHRDIKPDNIFVTRYGDFKLGDFGIARRLERTMSGLSKKGTPTYMAPEVYRGFEYGSNVDIYSLGIVMYRYLNKGRAPFLPDYPLEIFPVDLERAFERRINGDPLPLLKNVAPALRDIVMKATAPDRADRFASPTAMREAIEAFKSGKGIESVKVSRSGKEREPSKDSRSEKKSIHGSRKAALDKISYMEDKSPVGSPSKYSKAGEVESKNVEGPFDDMEEDYSGDTKSSSEDWTSDPDYVESSDYSGTNSKDSLKNAAIAIIVIACIVFIIALISNSFY